MANISITTACNRDCSYCFAQQAGLSPQPAVEHMSLEQFDEALDFLERSGIDQARLLGGEPTLHPQFTEIADRALNRNLRLLVFSNGLIPEPALRRLEEAPAERAAVLLNVTDLCQSSAPEERRQAESMERLGPRATLGVNICHAGVRLEPLLTLIRRFGLAPGIRFGLAHPSLDGSNKSLHPRFYKAAGLRLAEFARTALAAGVRVEFDCGFVPCMFPEGTLERLPDSARDLGLRCGPIPDVLPGGEAIACYPLASVHREPLPRQRDARWLRDRFASRVAPLRPLGIFRECAHCRFRAAGQCAGGCFAAAARRLRSQRFTVSVAERGQPQPHTSCGLETAEVAGLRARPWVIPYVDQPVEFWKRIHADFGAFVREVYFPLPGDVAGSGRPPQPDRHLADFLNQSPFALCVLVNPITLPLPVERLAPRVIEALRCLAGEHNVASVTVSNLLLAARIREAFPGLTLVASTLMEVASPNQVLMLEGVCDTLVPASRVMRNLLALQALRAAFCGRIRLIVNEACLPGCPYRVQHFHEMGSGFTHPRSLCHGLLERNPWMRLTGAWVLPQHLRLYDGLYDELKLAGRVTLTDEAAYRRILRAYVHRLPLDPHETGGGPASPLEPMEITQEFYSRSLLCGQQCYDCRWCRDYYEQAMGAARVRDAFGLSESSFSILPERTAG